MSDPRSKPPKRVLPVVGKSLMPEVLPSPLHASNLGASPRARVLKRLAQLSERAAALAAVASISAACNTGGGGGGGYMTVDPAPPPAGMGGGPPINQFACPVPDATLFDVAASWEGPGSFHIVIAPSGAAIVADFSIASARASSGASAELRGANDVIVTAPGGNLTAWPASMDVHVELRCASQHQVSSYSLALRFDTAHPASLGSLPFTVVDEDDADGGT